MANEATRGRVYPTPPTYHSFRGPSPWGVVALVLCAVLAMLFLSYFVLTFNPLMAIVVLAPFGLAVLLAVPAQNRSHTRAITFGLLAFMVFVWSLWPQYGGIDVPGMPVLSLPKVLFYAILVMTIWQLATSMVLRRELSSIVGNNKPVFVTLGVLLVCFLASTPLAYNMNITTYELVQRILFWFLPVIIACVVINSRARIEMVISALVASVTLLSVLANIEAVQQENPYVRYWPAFLTISSEWTMIAQESRFRAGEYRVQGPFSHPLAMAEFVALCVPFVLYRLITARNFLMQVIYFGIVVTCVMAVLAADSRSAQVAFLFEIALFIGLVLVRFQRFNPFSRYRVLVALFIAGGLAMGGPAILAATAKIAKGDTASTAASSQHRIDQWKQAIPRIAASPVVGYGAGNALQVLGYRTFKNLTVDCYYINIVLDTGIPGLIAMVTLFGLLMYQLFLRSYSRDGPEGHLLLALACAIMGFAIVKLVLSIDANFPIFFMVCGTALVALDLDRRGLLPHGSGPRS